MDSLQDCIGSHQFLQGAPHSRIHFHGVHTFCKGDPLPFASIEFTYIVNSSGSHTFRMGVPLELHWMVEYILQGVPIVISLVSITFCKGCSLNWHWIPYTLQGGSLRHSKGFHIFLQWATLRIHFYGFHFVWNGVLLRMSLVETISYNTLKHCLKTIS